MEPESPSPTACPSCGRRLVATDKYCAECGYPVGVVGTQPSDALLGKTLPGGYRIVEFIAEGSMGRVYRAEQANLGRSVAVKIMNSALLSHAKMIDRFRTEARAASILNHPNCTRVYDFGETSDKRPYLVMELLVGKDLELLLRDEPQPPVSRALDVANQILQALDEAHGQGVVHRDLKPANVFITSPRGGGDLVKVVDFGLAKLRSAISGATMTGQVCGTPAYMAPEQATAADTDGRTDLYALGVMLFEMLAGKPPFVSDDPTALLHMQVYDAPPKLSDIAPDRCPPGMDDFLGKLLAKDPKDRFENAVAASAALGEMLAARTNDRNRPFARASLRACSECGGLFPSTARFCGECGAPAPRESLPFPAAQSIPPPPPPPQIEELSAPTGADLSLVTSLAKSESNPERKHSTPSNMKVPPMPRRDTHPSGVKLAAQKEPSTGPIRRVESDRPEAMRRSDPRADEPSEGGSPSTSRTDPRTEEPMGEPRESVARAKSDSPSPSRSRRSRSLPPVRTTTPPPIQPGMRPPARRSEGTPKPPPNQSSGLPPSVQLVELESQAASLMKRGDVRGAVAALEQAVLVIRNDMDRGELDDPIGAMGLFLGKLGEANVEIGEPARALDQLREAISLMAVGPERVRLLLVMSRAARELGRDRESARYLEEAEREATERAGDRPANTRSSHYSIAPPSGDGDRISGVKYDAREERRETPRSFGVPPKKLSR